MAGLSYFRAMTLRQAIKHTPLLGEFARRVYGYLSTLGFKGSSDYWERRYRTGGNSGAGSYGRLARFKADTLNRFVAEHGITSVVEFGCGDGAQLDLAEYPRYLGLDVSPAAVGACRRRFEHDHTKTFGLLGIQVEQHDLALSLDVIFHLVEDDVFERHMEALFDASSCFVGIYASNKDEKTPEPHIRHRRFTDWVDRMRPDWRLIDTIPNAYPFDRRNTDQTSFANFYFFQVERRLLKPELWN